MKRRILYPIYVLALLLVLGSCQDEDWKGGQATDGDCLTLSVSTMAASRAEVVGEDRFNENTITRADVYFFSSDAEQNESRTCLYAHLSVPVSNNTLQVQLDKDIITDGNTYYIYVVANYDLLNGASATSKTLADLKGTVLTTNWKDGYSGNTGPEPSLVMDGATTVTISPEGTSGHVYLKRAMAKVMLFPTAEDEITVGEGDELVTYRPVLDRMRVTMVYGVNKTNLAGTYQVQANSDYITRMLRDYRQISGENDYEQVAPFYSYPNPEETTDRKDTYLILCVPWYVDGGGAEQAVNYYYRVPITGDDSPALMERNKYYEVHTKIGVLGSLNPHDAVTVSSNFIIHDWFTMNIDAAMNNYRYLVLDEYTSVMNNVDELSMPYISSSPISTEEGNKPTPEGYYTEITEVSLWNYRQTNARHQYYAEEAKSNYTDEDGNRMEYVGQIPNDYTIRVEGDNLVFGHPLTEDDYVAITITVTVYNEQGVEADEWTITQYPAMYIEGEYNRTGSSNRFVYGVNGGGGDGRSVTNDRGMSLGNVYDPEASGATNSNLNQYTIYISSFDIDDEYAIGDPRSETIDNLDYLGNKEDVNGRNLTYYYPSVQESISDINTNGSVVAPAFKIASSWGVVDGNGITFDAAKQRCASYQENGYPAGRWRVPTEGEIEYIISLSNADKIPDLFNGDYFASTGRYYDNGYQSSNRPGFYSDNGSHSVRCVYDVWYWGDEKIENPNLFTWGDEPRQ